MQVELELVDVAREKAGGHKSYRCIGVWVCGWVVAWVGGCMGGWMGCCMDRGKAGASSLISLVEWYCWFGWVV